MLRLKTSGLDQSMGPPVKTFLRVLYSRFRVY